MSHIAFGQDTIEKVDALLRSRDADELLTLAYSLTHKMHAVAQGEHAARSNGHHGLARELATEAVELRQQRNLLTAELLRRCAA